MLREGGSDGVQHTPPAVPPPNSAEHYGNEQLSTSAAPARYRW